MRLYGILDTDFVGEYFINNISTNIEDFKPTNNVYYTDNPLNDVFDFYDPFEKNWDAYWLPYNCQIVQYDIFNKDGEYYYEGDEPDNSKEGTLTFIYKEGKLVKQYFEEY